MTKKDIKKLLDGRHRGLKKIFYDEARKVETDELVARRLADEALDNLRLELENSASNQPRSLNARSRSSAASAGGAASPPKKPFSW